MTRSRPEVFRGFLATTLARQAASSLMFGGSILVAFGLIGSLVSIVGHDEKADFGLLVAFAVLGSIAVLISRLLRRLGKRQLRPDVDPGLR